MYLSLKHFSSNSILGIELQQLQWNMSYSKKKYGGSSFETQLNIEFLSSKNIGKQCLEKYLLGAMSNY